MISYVSIFKGKERILLTFDWASRMGMYGLYPHEMEIQLPIIW